MPRKQNKTSHNYNAAFPSRLRDLIIDTGTKQQELATAIGKLRQSVSCYADGSSSPDWETIVKIANFFNVSTDYLLGCSDIRSTKANIKEVCHHTGLTEKAAKVLTKSGLAQKIVNILLEYEYTKTGTLYMDAQELPTDYSPLDETYVYTPLDAFNEYFERTLHEKAIYTVMEVNIINGKDVGGIFPLSNTGKEIIERVLLDKISDELKKIKMSLYRDDEINENVKA